MSSAYGVVAVGLVTLATVAIGAYGLRLSRTTSDFYVASRSVGPSWNASAIGGEYLSAASFLGIAGLVLVAGVDVLWYPVGWTAGYLLLLVLVAAPLRRSGAYTIPDFTEVRLQSRSVRRISAVMVVVIGWLYLMPQFQGAGLVLRTVTGAPSWVGSVVVAVVVVANVVSGGMRSITLVQAFQYWLKLTALLVPLAFLVVAWAADGSPRPTGVDGHGSWVAPLSEGGLGLYATYSLIIATFLGTMGLPHVVVRFYTNPDGDAARRTTVIVLGLLGAFYLLPGIYGVLGRVYASDLVGSGRADIVVLELPGRVIGGGLGDLLAAVLTAGAFAAFLSTSSGLTMSVAGVVAQDATGRRLGDVAAFRLAAVLSVLVPLALAVGTDQIPVASSVGFAFAVAASTFCPLLVLGIWWRGLTAAGAAAGVVGGGLAAGGAVAATIVTGTGDAWWQVALAQPAAWSVPVGFGLMVGVSLLTRHRRPSNVARTMVRLHTPERVGVERADR